MKLLKKQSKGKLRTEKNEAKSENTSKKEFPKDGLVKLQDVLEFISMSKSTWYGLIEENLAPKQVKIKNMSRWDAKEIRRWKKNLKNQRN